MTPVVIGACFGDEGKGLLTDYLSGPNTIVVRFNGGAQAGHTVVTPKKRHVFHHLGSGSLAGAATHLSQFFIVNPFLWQKEIGDLGFTPKTTIHPDAALSTPYDMLVNQFVETSRGGKRHGSCGLGINETVERCEREYQTTVSDYQHLPRLTEKLIAIRECYVLSRLSELNLRPNAEFLRRLYSEPLLESFLEAAARMKASCQFRDDEYLRGKPVVFEGAQGLLLDQHHNFFPHVTRSNTGLTNVLEIAKNAGITNLHAYYVMRTYMTRHGVGPFPTENKSLTHADDTNQPNDWQGTLRFGDFDGDLVAEAIQRDLDAEVDASLVVTHADQKPIPFGEISKCGLAIGAIVTGPTRTHVQAMTPRAMAA